MVYAYACILLKINYKIFNVVVVINSVISVVFHQTWRNTKNMYELCQVSALLSPFQHSSWAAVQIKVSVCSRGTPMRALSGVRGARVRTVSVHRCQHHIVQAPLCDSLGCVVGLLRIQRRGVFCSLH